MHRGEVWLINLDPTVGSEMKKTRPAIIINDDSVGILPLKVVIPVTDWKDRYSAAPWMVRLEPDGKNGLGKVSAADSFQVRSVSQQRLVKKLGTVDETLLESISCALAAVLGLTNK
ncbi:MAG: type II toxin-antitoxin system PemK/MazF family toxin [Myxococcota bacterium]|jgi:mRNA interferase MazF